MQYTNTLYYINSLTLPTVFSEISLFFMFYISSFFKPLVLLQSPLKCLLLLKSLIQLLLFKLLVSLLLRFLTPWPLQLLFLVFLYTVKVYWFQSAILSQPPTQSWDLAFSPSISNSATITASLFCTVTAYSNIFSIQGI